MKRRALWPWRPYGSEGPTLLDLARQAWASTDEGYDMLAPEFEHTPFRTPDAVIRRTLSVLGDARFARGLDLCCGTGAALAILSERCDKAVGLDRSKRMLDVARHRVPFGHLVRGDALAPPFADASFDVACSFGAFGHILVEDEPRFVAAVARALRPGGRFVFITADPPPLLSKQSLFAHAFNAAIRARNAVKKPPFVMYYLTFLLPRAHKLLVDDGFTVHEHRGLVRGYVVVEAVLS